MKALSRKLLRELWSMKGQMGSIGLVVATGIMTVVTMRGGYESLVEAQAAYYRQARFADVWAPVKRAPNQIRREIEALPGVRTVDTRVTFPALLDLPDLDAPGSARFVSIPEEERPRLNDVRILRGRYVAPGARNEVLVNERFADARELVLGDSVRAVLNGRMRSVEVVGVASSPEHTYAVPPGALYPDDERYGVFWMSREVLGPAYDMEGGFNQVVLSLAPGADPAAVIERLDRILEPYGATGAYLREDQPSHQILQSELDQNRVMGTVIPLVFLAVAAFLLNLVLGRLVGTQRTEVAVLKAFGYSNRQVGAHYLAYALCAAGLGTVVGTAGGAWLGGAYVDIYREFFAFPELTFRLSPFLLLAAALVSTLAAALGAVRAVREASSLPPAQAMRPEPPPTFRPGPLERTGIGERIPSAGRMILRNLERRPIRAGLSAVGVAFSVAILVVGMFMFDGVDYMMDLQFRVLQREDLAISFQEPRHRSVRFDLANLDGVTRVETFRTAPARLRAGHREREVGLQGMDPDGRMRRIVTADGDVRPLPGHGVVLSAMLAEMLQVSTGDTLAVELLEGRRARGSLPVAAVIEDFLGLSAYVSQASLRRLAGGPDVASGAYLAVRSDRRGDVNRALKAMPVVASASSPADMLRSFEEQLSEGFLVGVAFLLGFAGVIAVGVIYNSARISLSERGRELASLRVMGFRRREVSTLLLGEQAVVTMLAIPLGWALGYALSFLVSTALRTEMYRIPLVLSGRTFALSALITIAAAVASGWLVRRRIDRLDLIAVLKTRE